MAVRVELRGNADAGYSASLVVDKNDAEDVLRHLNVLKKDPALKKIFFNVED